MVTEGYVPVSILYTLGGYERLDDEKATQLREVTPYHIVQESGSSLSV